MKGGGRKKEGGGWRERGREVRGGEGRVRVEGEREGRREVRGGEGGDREGERVRDGGR